MKGDAKLLTFRSGGVIARTLDVQKGRTAFIKVYDIDPVHTLQMPSATG